MLDFTPDPLARSAESGDYDMTGLVDRIAAAVRQTGATRVGLDSVGSLFAGASSGPLARRELARLVAGIRETGVDLMITAEQDGDHALNGQLGVEDYVADNVIVLRSPLVEHVRRRTIELLKARGSNHRKGEVPFTVDPDVGISVSHTSAIEDVAEPSTDRIDFGVPALNELLDGGIYRDHIVLVSGATGTGKTLLGSSFVKAAVDAGDRAMLFCFEESGPQLIRNARTFGTDLSDAVSSGLLETVPRYPEPMGLEDLLWQMKRDIDRFRPRRVVLDSLSALERGVTPLAFHEFVVGLTSYLKVNHIATVITSTTPLMLGGESATEAQVSTFCDTILLLRYAELEGSLHRGMVILKHRGSRHSRDIHQYTIEPDGFRFTASRRDCVGLLTGAPRRFSDGSTPTRSSTGSRDDF